MRAAITAPVKQLVKWSRPDYRCVSCEVTPGTCLAELEPGGTFIVLCAMCAAIAITERAGA